MNDEETQAQEPTPTAKSTVPPAPNLPPAAAGPSTQRGAYSPQRTPFLAGVLSAIVPGFGNVYNGLFTRGLLNFLVFVSLFFIATQSSGGPELALLLPAMLFTWLFGVIDSYRNATLINLGVTEIELQENLPQISKGGGGLAVGVAIFLIGLYGFLTQALEIDLTVIFDYWYVILMALGAWLTYNGLQNRKPDAGSEASWGESS